MVWSTEKEMPHWLPYIASLHYINTPKLALAHQQELARSCLNKKGATHHCPSSVWIWRKTINPLSSYIKPQITPPSPLKVAAQNGGSQRRVNSADSGSPRGKPARNIRRLTWRGGEGDACMWFGLAHFLNGYGFLMISPNLLDIWPVFFFILSRCKTLHFFDSN